MCGIFAAINNQPVTDCLIKGLEALSYRGYDSSGIVISGEQKLERLRCAGKIGNLSKKLAGNPLSGFTGIAHTRWATHGEATENNAHPHMHGDVAVVHNGIIENYVALRCRLSGEGFYFESDTDTEVIPVLISSFLNQGLDNISALRSALEELEGSYAVAVVFASEPNTLYAARNGSPLVIGKSEEGFLLASDTIAFGLHTAEVCHLKDGDVARVSLNDVSVSDTKGQTVSRAFLPHNPLDGDAGKQGFRHYMMKEIQEQPAVVARTLEAYSLDGRIDWHQFPVSTFIPIERFSFVACGTSYYAGMIGKYWMENLASLPSDVDIASEYRYRNSPIAKHTSTLFISQSGETADTLAALRYTKALNSYTLSMINVPTSTMANESDSVMRTYAGPEIGVASTKAFTGQLVTLLLLALATARSHGNLPGSEQVKITHALSLLPKQISDFLSDTRVIQDIAGAIYQADNALFLGRGVAFPLALEGALKLKEISYIHAEAYPAGELKHGPIALVDKGLPVVIIAPPGDLQTKTLSNLREVTSRGAKVILISDADGIAQAQSHIFRAIEMPDVHSSILPILYTLPLQLLAYYVAALKGTDIDQPRNLAKSVTVE
ncbi:glutamine--fructose-6-phosphate transaminase (isomerizing) [Parasalinivibrio latis]|uniref:glutamine--fructose-6-phosphate transaminase (isomerizing) n=1 Tax=Parasalinivibrio latis TaxID=2952610 RepID=UPI0030E081FC